MSGNSVRVPSVSYVVRTLPHHIQDADPTVAILHLLSILPEEVMCIYMGW